ncbi:hypothetical protein PAMP_004798 [Pampus punctatissimus]
MGSVSWGPSDGAKTYVAIATGLDGHTRQCLTNTTNCTWDNLHCGEEYTVVVKAKDGNCTSLPSNSSVIYMDPCVPQNVVASVNCDMKVVSLSWDASNGTELYMVSAQGGYQSTGLTTNVTTAYFSDFMCGQNYSLTVTPHNQHCPGHTSAPASIQTWPCLPVGVSTMQDCFLGIAMVTWQLSNGTDYYIATMQSDSGVSAMCISDSNKCSVPGLNCGHNFSMSVTASNQQCNVTSSRTARVQSVPCVPTSVSVELDCANNTAVVTWSASQGAVLYSVTAYSSHSNTSCQTSDLTCRLYNLTCGSRYTVYVVAIDDTCSSIPSQALVFNSAPCSFSGITAYPQCHNSSILVVWDLMEAEEGNTMYIATAEASDHTYLSCNNTGTSCSLHGTRCDLHYTIIVAASSDRCSSMRSPPYRISMEPCPPKDVKVNSSCEDSALVSWTTSPVAKTYHVVAKGIDGHVHTCNTTSSNCSFSELHCDQQYTVFVTASHENCSSKASQNATLYTAPCPPDVVQVQLMPMQMEIQILQFSWTQSTCRDTQYILKVMGSLLGDNLALFDLSSYWTSRTYFEIPLPCGSYYVATVESRNAAGTSDPSVPLNETTAPCPPSDVAYSINGSFATISWNASMFATTYTVYDNHVSPKAQLCSTAGLSCSLSNITSTNLLITASNAAGESEAKSVPNGGLSAPMLDVTQMMSTVFIHWSQVDTASHYILVIRPQGTSQESQELVVYGESIILTDLSPTSTYCFFVSARNVATSGPESEPVCVQTGQRLL